MSGFRAFHGASADGRWDKVRVGPALAERRVGPRPLHQARLGDDLGGSACPADKETRDPSPTSSTSGARPGRRLRPPRRRPAARLVPRSGGPGGQRAQRGGYDTGHQPKHPLKIKAKRDAQKEAALQRVLKGKKPFAAKGKGQQVPLELEGTDRIFVVLAEFGDERYPDPRFPDADSTGPDRDAQRFDGPLHNQIPEPDRTIDNSHAVAGGLQPEPLRGHVLQPDEGVLRAPVLRPLLGRRRRHRVGEGAVQRGALRPRLLRRASSARTT